MKIIIGVLGSNHKEQLDFFPVIAAIVYASFSNADGNAGCFYGAGLGMRNCNAEADASGGEVFAFLDGSFVKCSIG